MAKAFTLSVMLHAGDIVSLDQLADGHITLRAGKGDTHIAGRRMEYVLALSVLV